MADDLLNPVSLMPSAGEFDLTPGTRSLFGGMNSYNKAQSAQQFIDAQLQRLPQENQLKMMQTQGQIEDLPQEQANRKEKLKQEYAALKGKPAQQFVDEAAELWPNIKDKNPFEKAQAHGRLVQGWKQRHPGLQLPQELENYVPDVTDKHLEDAHNMKMYSTAHRQELEKGAQREESHLVGADITGQYHLRAAQARAAAGQGQKEVTIPVRIRQLNQLIHKPGTSDEEKDNYRAELEGLVDPLIDDKLSKKWGDEMNALIFSRNNPDLAEKRRAGMESDRASLRRSYGLDAGGLPPKGGDRIRITKDGKNFTVPKSQLETAKKQGYKEAK